MTVHLLHRDQAFAACENLPNDLGVTVQLDDGFCVDTLIINPGCERQIVFFHGVGGAPEIMLLLEWLAAEHDVTIFAPHMPCHGQTGDVESLDELVDRLIQWCDKLRLQNVAIIGHSLGALALVYLACARPDIVLSGICLAMPNRQPVNEIEFNARLALVFADAVLSASYALIDASLNGRGQRMLEALCGMAHSRFRIIPLAKLLRAVDDSEIDRALARLLTPVELVFGSADLAVRPIHPEGSATCTVKRGYPHNFPLLRPTWRIISEALQGALNASSIPLAPVIPRNLSLQLTSA